MSDRPNTPLLDRVTPSLLISSNSLMPSSRASRRNCGAETISAVSETGGHLGAGTGRRRADSCFAFRFQHTLRTRLFGT